MQIGERIDRTGNVVQANPDTEENPMIPCISQENTLRLGGRPELSQRAIGRRNKCKKTVDNPKKSVILYHDKAQKRRLPARRPEKQRGEESL